MTSNYTRTKLKPQGARDTIMSNSENSGLVNIVEAMRASSVLKAVKTMPVPKTIGERLSAFAHVYGEGNGYTGHKLVTNGYNELKHIDFKDDTGQYGHLVPVKLGTRASGATIDAISSRAFKVHTIRDTDTHDIKGIEIHFESAQRKAVK